MSEEGYERAYVEEAFKSNWIAPLGFNVSEFEREIAGLVGVHSAVATSSGTAAIHLALKAAGVGKDDIVLCQSLTFAATVNPVLYQGAVPVLIDSDERSWNMDPDLLEQAFIRYPAAKAVLVVHLYGFAADLDPIIDICRRHGATLIEDAAESLGTRYKGRTTGSLGDYGIFSFNGNKIITTSGGGMLVSNQEERIEKARFWATQSRDPGNCYQHSEVGSNYRMSNVLAGIGRGQLKVLDQRIQKKKAIYDYYQKGLGDLEGVRMMPLNDWNEPNFWLSCMTLSDRVRPLDILQTLEEANIESRLIWKPMQMQPAFRQCDFIGDGISEQIFNQGICLPSDTKMSEEVLAEVVSLVRGLWDR